MGAVSDPRPLPADSPPPRPQFGEYASPEEQSRRAGRPLTPTVVHAPPAASGGPQTAAEGSPAAPPVDRLAAVALLACGAWNVIRSVGAYLNPGGLSAVLMRISGVTGDFSSFAQLKTGGVVAGAVLIVGWICTAVWTVYRLRRGRRAWWVPLVGGIVVETAAAFCIVIPFMSDPAVLAFLNAQLQK